MGLIDIAWLMFALAFWRDARSASSKVSAMMDSAIRLLDRCCRVPQTHQAPAGTIRQADPHPAVVEADGDDEEAYDMTGYTDEQLYEIEARGRATDGTSRRSVCGHWEEDDERRWEDQQRLAEERISGRLH